MMATVDVRPTVRLLGGSSAGSTTREQRRARAGWRSTLPAILVLLAGIASAADGSVRFSDGSEKTGTVTLQGDLRFMDAASKEWIKIPAAKVRAISQTVEYEALEASWTFPEPGKPRKILVGKPYPSRTFGSELTLSGGERLVGHLYPAAVFVQDDAGTTKVVLTSKQVGKEGGSLADLVYPVRIDIPGPTEEAAPARIRLPAGAGESGILTLPDLIPMTPHGERLPGPVVAPVVVAARVGAAVVVAWPSDDAALRARLEPAVQAVPDFPDERLVIAAWHAGDTDTALLRLRRIGVSTSTHPWRVEVWRFRTDPVGGGAVLAARGLLLRGLGEPPDVKADPVWWQQRVVDGVLQVGP